MTRADLLALAARVEAAQGVDRELDAEIALACGIVRSRDGNTFYGHKHHSCVVLERGYYDHDGNAPELEHFTASLDAAAALARMSSGFIAAMGDIAADGLPGVCLCVSTDPIKEVWGISTGGGADPDGRLARAMTAAALRAMAEEAPDA